MEALVAITALDVEGALARFRALALAAGLSDGEMAERIARLERQDYASVAERVEMIHREADTLM